MDVLQRRVAQEDTVQYKLFLVKNPDSNEIENRLLDLMKEILGKCATLLAQYIWHHQPFNLNFVLRKVTFTRCLYAQLQQQQFTPDRRSGFALPPSSDPKYKAHELGMKLAHGFEILCSKAAMPSSEPNAPVSCNPQWKGFIDCLKRNGYFRGEIEGSALYKDLIHTAENFFKLSVYSEYKALSPGEEVLQLLQSLTPFSLEELKEKESQLPPEDSDSWMDITEQDLEQMFQERMKKCDGVEKQKSNESCSKEKTVCSQVEDDAGYSLVAVSQGMKNFLNAMSSHEGAELPCFSQPFTFDPHSMVSALDKLLVGNSGDELDSDDLDDDDDDDDTDEAEKEFTDPSDMDGSETLKSLKKYMDQMDEELMDTNIGQSFNQDNVANPQNGSPHSSGEGRFNTDEAGLAGPASNLLQSLGLHLPPNSDPS
ncbi:hypothetical protein WMY93_018656 [Mugilogobius chulae]|uniref:Uncharacterized protein n=1 Tax=Mugilogobius chulae TaxID=88201 RepID=A0AAW0NPG0_9GOBI